jgi:hypothetical protein
MSADLHIAPAPGLIVRDPVTKIPLAADGETKPRNSYWLRRLADGDVRETAPPPTERATPKKKESDA